MLLQENFINYEDSRLHYAKAGSGATPLLLFHGFGQNHQVFERWVPALGKEYSLYAFDLYFHGKSTWPGRVALEKNDWKEIIQLFLKQEKIERFAVLGFSLGGKFAMTTAEAFPEKIIKLYLLAPDGIKTSIWYSLATYPIAVRYLFRSMILKPGRLHALAKVFRSLGIVDKGILRFAESQMDTEEKRRRVYYSWVYFRHLKFNLRQLANLLNTHQIPVIMIAGKYDKVIEAKNMNLLLRYVNNHRFEIIEAGHNDLIKNAIKFI
jgi:pimeloyl-ACP methyl ester carboxylesterase